VQKPLKKDFFDFNTPKGKTMSFELVREVSGRFEFSPGRYVIVPSTFYPNENGKFLLRILTDSTNEVKEYK
jgi:hypothetical protein